MSTILSVDIGTTKICALAYDSESGKTIATRSAANESSVPGLPAGRHEQDPVAIRDCCLGLLRGLVSAPEVQAEDVAAIGFSAQMHGLLLVDADFTPATAFITWRDQRATEDADLKELVDSLGDDTPNRTGCHLHPGYGGLTLAWLGKRGSVPPKAIALGIGDYVAASLCGVASTEATVAASWGILDIEKGCWDAPTVRALEVPCGMLPRVEPSATPLGLLLPDQAERLGLPGSVQVCAPVGDNQASVMGAAGSWQGGAVLNLGTGGQISLHRRDFSYCEGLETRPMPLGGYIQVGASLCGGWSYAYLREFFQNVAEEFTGTRPSDAEAYERMNALASGYSDEAPAVDTRFSGTRGCPEVRGSISAISTANLTPAALAKAFAAGMVQELYDMAQQAGVTNFARIIATGNAARRNPVVHKAVETLFGAPCILGQAAEEAALGAAIATARRINSAS